MAALVDLVERRAPPGAVETDAVAVKALLRVFKAWKINAGKSAKLAGVSERTWTRMGSGTWSGSLSQDQLLRASALVGLYKGLHLYFGADLADTWVSLNNRGPLFQGSSPVEFMTAGGLPAIMDTRDYVDAVRGGL
jgi:hypothetical protein